MTENLYHKSGVQTAKRSMEFGHFRMTAERSKCGRGRPRHNVGRASSPVYPGLKAWAIDP